MTLLDLFLLFLILVLFIIDIIEGIVMASIWDRVGDYSKFSIENAEITNKILQSMNETLNGLVVSRGDNNNESDKH